MPDIDPIRPADRRPSGADFYKCALQVNPHHYSQTYRGQPQNLDADAYADAIVAQAIEQGISVLAITDHNNVGGIETIRGKAKERGIRVFPGFELTSSEGIHVLCLYALDTTGDQLGRYLGRFGIANTGPSADLANQTFAEILKVVREEQGGIAIAAHATHANGLFEVLDGQARIHAWRDRHLMAVQIPGKVDELPQDVRQIVQNKNPDYRRRPGAGDGLPVAVVNAKDVVNPDGLADPSASCWIKMSEVGIEGLRQAFLDPDSRIRLNSDPVPEQHSELVAVTWEGGFLDGTAVHFNTNLNVLVGGRGTGKSTVIESLRYVLALDTVGEDARKAHEGIVRHVLRSGTKVSLLVRSYRPSKQEYVIERTVPNPPVVRTDTGQVSNLLPQDVLPRIEVYGQHEISELTRNPEKLTRLLNRFIDRDAAAARRKSDLRRELERNRRGVLDVQRDLAQVEERLAALPSVEETLKRFQDAGLENRLREQSLLVREERVLNTVTDRIQTFRDDLENLRRELPIDRAFLSPKALEELPGKEILAAASDVLDRFGRDLEQVVQAMESAIRQADSGMADVRKRWDARKNEVQAAYEKILRELQKSRVDGEEFIRLRRQIEELRPLRERKAVLQRAMQEQASRRRELLTQWEDIKAEEVRALDRAAKRASKKLRDRVDVQVTAAGDREPLAQLLRDKVGGRLSETIDTLTRTPDLSLPALVKACQDGTTTVNKAFGIPLPQADRLAKAPAEVLMQIEELDLPASTTIKLNTAPAGSPPAWQALEELSTGQKATAVLLLLLLESDAPLIVDQPEDDLDNRFITEGVVPRMREEKRRRQFVFSTHNANIPVLGDAELILGLKAQGEAEHGTASVPDEYMASIDSKEVRELVEEILEGGREAFEMRRLKYGF
jgi:DNA repair ATPase RecN